MMIRAQDLQQYHRLAYPYPFDVVVYDVQFTTNNQVKVFTGDNGTGTSFYGMDEMVPVEVDFYTED